MMVIPRTPNIPLLHFLLVKDPNQGSEPAPVPPIIIIHQGSTDIGLRTHKTPSHYNSIFLILP